jgi:hypothetical protein
MCCPCWVVRPTSQALSLWLPTTEAGQFKYVSGDRVALEKDFLLSALFHQYSVLVFHTSNTDAT